MKKIKRFKKKGYITYFNSAEPVLIPKYYLEKDPHLRGVWVSTVANIDIPKMKDANKYKEYLLGIIQKVKEYKLNTIIFQVRPSNDAFYQSRLNPWSRFITGKEGEGLGFDILEWFISEAKKEDISVHAWINPYRVSTEILKNIDGGLTKEEYLNKLDDLNYAKRNPNQVIFSKEGKLILDPASQQVRDYVTETVLEIASNYDVEAVHIDDYFYPYDGINDSDEEEKYNLVKDHFNSIHDFRRENVNLLIKQIHEALLKLDKKVEFGISPFGVYRTNSKHFPEGQVGGWEKGSNNHHSCLEAYEKLYCDVYYWMEQKWIDYVVPQDYFDFNYTKETTQEDGSVVETEIVKYADLVDWWSWAAKETNTKLYIGQGLYRYQDKGNWSNPKEIINQLHYNNKFDNVSGTIFFTYKNLVESETKSLVKARKLLTKVWKKRVKDI